MRRFPQQSRLVKPPIRVVRSISFAHAGWSLIHTVFPFAQQALLVVIALSALILSFVWKGPRPPCSATRPYLSRGRLQGPSFILATAYQQYQLATRIRHPLAPTLLLFIWPHWVTTATLYIQPHLRVLASYRPGGRGFKVSSP